MSVLLSLEKRCLPRKLQEVPGEKEELKSGLVGFLTEKNFSTGQSGAQTILFRKVGTYSRKNGDSLKRDAFAGKARYACKPSQVRDIHLRFPGCSFKGNLMRGAWEST